MGQKDIAEKMLEAYNDVFADIVNVLLFDGEGLVKDDELEEQILRTGYKAEGKLHEVERDVAKRWKNSNIRLASIGIENQTLSDADMPLRVIGYDGVEYRAQLNTDNAERYPVITLVLYFGHKKHWDKPLSLYERLDIHERLKPYVCDYRINLFEVAYLNRETVNKFKSDFKVVADYLVQMQETGTYVGSEDELKHVDAALKLMSVVSEDHRFEEMISVAEDSKREVRNMCEALDRIEQKGRIEGIAVGKAEGIAVGKAEGKAEGFLGAISILFQNGGTEEQAAKLLNATPEQIQEAKKLLEM